MLLQMSLSAAVFLFANILRTWKILPHSQNAAIFSDHKFMKTCKNPPKYSISGLNVNFLWSDSGNRKMGEIAKTYVICDVLGI